MYKRIYWGLAILMLLICIGFVFLTLRNLSEIRQMEEDLADVKDLEQHVSQQADVGNRPPRDARAGHEWEWHGDHWREIPVTLNDVPSQTSASDEIGFEPAEVRGPFSVFSVFSDSDKCVGHLPHRWD